MVEKKVDTLLVYVWKAAFLISILVLLYSFLGCIRPQDTSEPSQGTEPPVSSQTTKSTLPLQPPLNYPPVFSGGGAAQLPAPTGNEFNDAVLSSDLIVSGNITDLRYEVIRVEPANVAPGWRVYTIFTLSVDKVIKGDPDTKQIFIKADGGYNGEIFEGPTGWYFKISDQVMLGLRKNTDNTYTVLPNGMYWIHGSAISRTSRQAVLGNVVKSMLEQDIPIVLPASEWPDIPIGPVQLPEKSTQIPEGPNKASQDSTTILFNPQPLAAGWNNLMTEYFEGAFPADNDWELHDDPTWDDDDYKSHGGGWSGWCARGGDAGVDPQYNNILY